VIVKHFSALSMCPVAGFALGDAKELVCHCLVVETKRGLVVVDTGLFAETDFSSKMRAHGYFLTLMRVARDRELTAARAIERLGYRAADVTHVVCTHLDLDHAGGIADFPDAEIHVLEDERAAAEKRATRNERRRYIASHFTHAKWKTRAPSGETWNGFSAVRALHEDEPDVLLVPLAGHTRGHAGVAVRAQSGWLLHCGDAYFHRDEMTDAAKAPWGLELFQKTMAIDDALRRENQRRLRELKKSAPKDGANAVTIFCAHSKAELEEGSAS